MLSRWYLLPLFLPLLAVMVACSLASIPMRVVWWPCCELGEHLMSSKRWNEWNPPSWRWFIFGRWYP